MLQLAAANFLGRISASQEQHSDVLKTESGCTIKN